MKVLLADDEPSALYSLKYIIETHCKNFEIVSCVSNGREAIDKSRVLKPDIVLTDIKMPLVDGIEVVENLRVYLPGTSSVIVSGYQDFEYAKSALRSGVVDYLLKPLDVKQLCSLLDKLYTEKYKDYRLTGVF